MNEFTIQILMLVLLFAVMYFILIRPQKKREKEVTAMRDNLKVGDDVLTIGGIYGKIVRTREDRFTIQVGAEKVRLEVAKWAVSQKITGDEKSSKVVETKSETDSATNEAAAKPTPKTIKKLGAKGKGDGAGE
ncbi:MAG: preprotein translocase subunit YajC [Bacillota bacterium]|nr:preprotein translocase subunit YajC [Eubacteriales bacterium]MDI9491757.1 preprotein translocase subunit YajC [Bacillota bacterium]NLV70275.1 preprotein translocase subunit YajC [Clostridiales bacterium]HRV33336.1 preprotein translocase subunit YajC [Anaerovoracaceae bacterium]MDD3537220.1 preprotein translocase subunit YajC [Eubacteriales bacterium]